MNFTFPAIAHEVQPVMDVINLVIFIILFSTLLVAILQFRWERQAEKERDRATFARELYRDYLKTSLENPDLSSAQYDKKSKISADKYDTFVSIMLYAFDEMTTQGKIQ